MSLFLGESHEHECSGTLEHHYLETLHMCGDYRRLSGTHHGGLSGPSHRSRNRKYDRRQRQCELESNMQSEPALILGVINALIALGVGFGLNVTSEQVGLINAAVAAIVAVITRAHVSPLQK